MTAANENEASDIELLLPWHAAGTLSQHEAQRVEAALAGDPELARRYELVREELGETIHLNETLGAPTARAMSALFQKIDAEPARAPGLSLNFGARVREFFASLSPRTLAWSASAAAIAILLQAGLIAGIMFGEGSPTRVSSYGTASVPTNVGGEGSYALIRFQPNANAADIGKFLESNKLSLVGGPAEGGLFRVQVAPKKLSQSDLASTIKKLQEDKVVGLIVTTN
jgi:hypothetical protein